MLELLSAGAPYARGLAHGRRFAPLVREHVETTCQIEARWEPQIAELSGCIERNLGRHAPGQLEELRGIAAGAGVALSDVFKLNFWPELTSGTVGCRFCSLVAFTDVAGGPLLGKNSDHPLPSLRFFALQRVHGPAQHNYLRGTFVGTTGTRGALNDAGLGICGAAIVSREVNRDGVPVMVLIQAILESCATVDEAIALAEGLPAFSYGAHLMVGDAGGHAAVIERLPDRMAVRRPEDGVLFNTNHPLAPETRDHHAAEPALNANSHERCERLGELCAGCERSVDGLKALLSCHDMPGAICQHGGPAGLHTTSSYILAPARGEFWMAPGCPCQHDYQRYTLADI